MELPEFLRTHHIRAPNVMWFLGAGASAAGGIPTAADMIWDFKRNLYCSTEKRSLRSCSDLSDPSLRVRLQSYFDEKRGYPATCSDDEYAGFFESAYPADADRRTYIQSWIQRGRPSFGHDALAKLLSRDRIRAIWTTNFDRLVEDAAFSTLGSTARLTIATIDSASIALDALNEGRWPLLVKLHGDFQSRRLKNVTDELRSQDAKLRAALVESCKRCGLAVVGYSGRDASVMEALNEAAAPGAFPAGLFWLHRGDAAPTSAVEELVQRARTAKIDAHVVKIPSFDELFDDLLLLEPKEPGGSETRRKARCSDAPLPDGKRHWPVIRANALRLDPVPALCRLVECSIGGYAEVRCAVAAADAKVIIGRRKTGVLAFGRDAEVRKAFEPFNITRFDLQPIQPHRMAYDSAEKGMLYQSLSTALGRQRPLHVLRRGRTYFALVDPAQASAPELTSLRSVASVLCGTVPDTNIQWREGVRLGLDYKHDAAWLLFEPVIFLDRPGQNGEIGAREEGEADPDHASDPVQEAEQNAHAEEHGEMAEAAREFVRERSAARYNSKANQLFEAWAFVLAGGTMPSEVSAFGIADGVDATFRIHPTTAFSRRAA